MANPTSTLTDAHRVENRATESRHRVPRDKASRLPTYIRHRRRKPKEVVTRSAAIQAHCRECMGWDSGGLGSVAEAVRVCTAPECWLYPWRNGKLGPKIINAPTEEEGRASDE